MSLLVPGTQRRPRVPEGTDSIAIPPVLFVAEVQDRKDFESFPGPSRCTDPFSF